MTGINYYLFLLFWAGVVIWQLISGKALGTWWRPRSTRQESPGIYWFVLIVQGAIFIAFLRTGTTWHTR
jgi:hypothetical protein